ncbi:MAG TPA: hypothetical protein VK900_06545 [Anaerolineales bacterium]|nr:hypothetical protein [Anaerolineales bacterium]
MKTMLLLTCLAMVCILAACQNADPVVDTNVNREFSLAPGQSASVRRADLTITFNYVLSDDRCPIQIECAASGPVTVSLTVQQGDAVPFGLTLETLTDQEGRSPGSPMEGIRDAIEAGDYFVRVLGVVPYPRNLSGIKASDYQATFIVTPK